MNGNPSGGRGASLCSVLRADLNAAGLEKFRLRDRYLRPEVHFVRVLRRAEAARRDTSRSSAARVVYVLRRVHLEILSRRYSFTIPLDVFGPGLSIAHRGPIVVNSDAHIGRNCRLHPGVTIGATRGLAPTAGDGLFLAPGASIYGGIQIGDRVHVGPNVVVTEDLPSDVVVHPLKGLTRQRGRG